MKEYQVVLSIFKGANFVVKRPGGIQCKIIGKVNDSVLESRVFNLNTTCSEPDFNYQIAWKLDKKKFQELRLNRGNVKIECHQLTSDGKIESLIGYCLISIKEAIEITSYEEIDVKNSKLLPLTGTKQPWLQYGPKLYCMLHFEDPDKVIATAQKRKMVLKNPIKSHHPSSVKAPLPPPPSARMAPTEFSWTVNNEMGYFQLGQPGPSDDLYIMNITLICVQHLRQLLVQKTLNPSSLEWQIVFEAFGMTVRSDVFTLPDDDCESECKQTYLGDKSTARIRASEQEFTRFLNQSVLEMKIVTLKDEKAELQGRAFIELETLTNPEIIEIRSAVDIMPERAKNMPRQHKPKISQIVDVKKSPNFFAKNYIKIEDICFAGANLTSSKENLAQLEKDLSSMSVQDNEDRNRRDKKDEIEGAATPERVAEFGIAEFGAGDKSDTVEEHAAEAAVAPEGQSYRDPLENKYESKATSNKSPAETTHTQQQIPASGRSEGSASTVSAKSRAVSIQEKDYLPSPIKLPKRSKVPPGNYDLNMKFLSMNIKCRRPFETDWFVVFHHPPLSVGSEDKTILHAKPKDFDGKKNLTHFNFDEDETERWVLAIPKITQEILETPLKIFFYYSTRCLDEDPIAFANVPLGDIFTVDNGEDGRNIQGSVAVYTLKGAENQVIRIGFIRYDFTLSEAKPQNDSEAASTSLFSVTSLQQEIPKENNASKYASRKENSIEDWRAQEEKKFAEKLKEKEKAYFQMLAAEHKKQKEDSEKIINERLTEMENKKRELEKKVRLVNEKEENLKLRELQLSESTRTNQFQLHQELEELKLKMRSMEADKNTEIKSLKRQLDDAADLLKIANEKNRCLEIKLTAKDEEIAKLMSSRNTWPDLEALVKIEKLEQEIEQQKKNLKKALEEKDTYRAQNQKLVKALQQQSEDSREQLRTENENLKLQMLAAMEHERLNKERKQVENISQEIRNLQRTGQVHSAKQRHSSVHPNHERRSPHSSGPSSDHVQTSEGYYPTKFKSIQERDALLEQEIDRLTRSREGLLKTQAYTKYDPLIREIEQEILRNIQLRAELQQSD